MTERPHVWPTPDWETPDGSIRLYCGDCLEILPTLPEGAVDAVVTDPPYGIGEAAGKNISRSRGNVAATDYGVMSWDDTPAQIEVELAMTISRQQVVFGGNYYKLPPSSCWLIWDKLNSGDFADCEIAWTNLKRAVRIIRHRWNGMIREGNEKRVGHPTQKPLAVMAWAVGFTDGDVLDPFMGSGTTGVACVNLGRRFIGIEKEPRYFKIAVKRIEDALGKGTLFDGIEEMTQAALFEKEYK